MWLSIILPLLYWKSQLFELSLWWGDLGNLPYQCQRICDGDLIYRDFAAKNPPLIFVVPSLGFWLLGCSTTALSFLTVLQFGLLLLMAYRLAWRWAPSQAFWVVPLMLYFCWGSCGLMHHVWAAAVGLWAIPSLYDRLFQAESPAQWSDWLKAGLILGLLGGLHQVLYCTMLAAVWAFALTGSTSTRVVGGCIAMTVNSILLNLLGWSIIGWCWGASASYPLEVWRSLIQFVASHQQLVVNSPWNFSDLLDLGPWPGDFFQGLNWSWHGASRLLGYLGFPLFSLLLLAGRSKEDEPVSRRELHWLLLSGSALFLASFPQFGFAHIRAFGAPVSLVLLLVWREGEAARGWFHRLSSLSMGALVLAGLWQASMSLLSEHRPIYFAAGALLVNEGEQSNSWSTIIDTIGADPDQYLAVYPYFPMAYFLMRKKSRLYLHEIYPGALMDSTGVGFNDAPYQTGLRALRQHPPKYCLRAMQLEEGFRHLGRGQQDFEVDPLANFIRDNYAAQSAILGPGGQTRLVLLRHLHAGN